MEGPVLAVFVLSDLILFYVVWTQAVPSSPRDVSKKLMQHISFDRRRAVVDLGLTVFGERVYSDW